MSIQTQTNTTGALEAFRADRVPFSLIRMSPQDDIRILHQHSYVELVVITGGHGTHLLRDNAWPIERGDVFVIPPQMEHGYGDCEDLHLSNLCIDASWCERNQLQSIPGFHALISLEPLLRSQHDFSSHLHLEDNKLSHLEYQLQILTKEMREQNPGFRQCLEHRLDLLLIDMAREHGHKGSQQHGALLLIEHVLHFIDSNYKQPISLDILSSKAAMSVSTLSRYFQRCFQCSPMHYVLQRRLRYAQELLRNSNRRIADIASAVGIADANYFSRVYKKHMGHKPQHERTHTHGE